MAAAAARAEAARAELSEDESEEGGQSSGAEGLTAVSPVVVTTSATLRITGGPIHDTGTIAIRITGEAPTEAGYGGGCY